MKRILFLLMTLCAATAQGVNDRPRGGGGSSSATDPHPYLSTTGDITLLVSAAGADGASGCRTTTITTGDLTACPFLTIPAAVAALPEHIQNEATILIAAGTYTLTPYTGLGDFGRFTWGVQPSFATHGGRMGEVRLKAQDGLVAVSGASGLACAASGDATILRLAADPGWVADTYKRYFVRISSGTGAGQYKAIRSHTGTDLKVAGRFSPSPDATSVAEIVESSVKLDENVAGRIELVGTYSPTMVQIGTDITSDVFGAPSHLVLDALDIRSSKNSGYGMHLMHVGAKFSGGTRLLGFPVVVEGAAIALEDVILSGNGVTISLALLNVYSGSVRTTTSSKSWIIGGSSGATSGVVVSGNLTAGSMHGAMLYLFEGSIDDVPTAVKVRGQGAQFYWSSSRLKGSGISTAGVSTYDGARSKITASQVALTDALGSDAPAQFLLDDVQVLAADIAGGVVKSFAGNQGSILVVQ